MRNLCAVLPLRFLGRPWSARHWNGVGKPTALRHYLAQTIAVDPTKKKGYVGVSENSVPLFTQFLLIIIPNLNGYFIGNIPYFQTNPCANKKLQVKVNRNQSAS